MKRKAVSIILMAAMTAGLLAGCGSTSTSSTKTSTAASATTSTAGSSAASAAGTSGTASTAASSTAAKSDGSGYKIGINCYGSSSYALLTLANNAKTVFESYGDDVTVSDDNFQVDKIVQDIENMISSGVQGLAVWLPADSLYETVAQKCEEAKVPFVLIDKIPTDETIAAKIKSNPYFAGAVSPANAVYGEQMADYAIKQGYKTCIVSSSAVGDPSDTPRLDAFKEKFTAQGGTIAAELHSDSNDKIQSDIEDALIANPDVEFIYGIGSDFGIGAVGALENQGKTDVKVLTSGLDSKAVEYLADSKITVLSGDDWVSGTLSAVILQNYLDGNALKDSDGNVPYVEDIQPFTLTTEQSSLFNKVFIDNYFYTDDEISSMRTKNNSSFDYDAFIKVKDDFSFENRAKALSEAGIVSADDLTAAGIK